MPLPLRILIAAILLCAPLPVLAQPPAPVTPPTVARVQFNGRVNVGEEILLKAVELKPGASFSDARMEADRKALLGLGYFRAVGASQRTTDGKTDVTFRLTEWPKIAHIRVLGNTVLEQKVIRDVISTRLGQVLCAPQLQNDVRAIESLYRERGYVAHISEKLVQEATRTGILRFEILEVAVDDVVLEGGTAELRDRARRELKELPPRLYRPDDVAQDQQRLARVRGVKTATPRVEPTSASKVRIRWLLNAPEMPEEPATSPR